jgi:PASTA domain
VRARIGVATVIAACITLSGAALAPAKTVTIGSPMTAAQPPIGFGASRTLTITALPEPGATVSAPANGTVTSWSVSGAIGGPLRLRLVRPVGGLFTGAGTSSAGTITGTGKLTFPTTLPIKKGDLIGVDPANDSDAIGGALGLPGSLFMFFNSELVNGGPGAAPAASGPGEPALSAQVLLNCVVPKLTGKKVKAAKKALAKAGCAPPKLKKKGKFVKSQNPKPGKEIPSNRAVVLKRRP